MNEPIWKVWRNPIVRRYAAARLRWPSVVAWSIIVQSLAAFLWLGFYFADSHQRHTTIAVAASHAWLPILVLQGILWIMKGTFSVAVGIAREGVEGLTEAQRLTPMSAWHKVVGYLVGLPIRETMLVVSLLPWTIASVWLGHLPFDVVFRVHLLLLTSAVLHHAIGLVAGTVIRQKIVAGTVSQLIVILLHVIVPAFAKLGLGPLGHLGVETAIAHELAPFVTETPGLAAASVRFFHWEFALTGYQWVTMTLLLAVLLVVVWRRWQRADAHLLSKPLALAFFAGVLVMSLGEITPRLQDGTLFRFNRRAVQINGANGNPVSEASIALLWAGGFGSVGLLSAMLLGSSIAPTLDQYLRARRVSDRHVSASLPWFADARGAVPWTMALGLVLLVAWLFLVREVLATPLLHTLASAASTLPVSLGGAILVPLVAWTLLVEWRSTQFAFMAVFLAWLVPPMIATVSIIAGTNPDAWPKWLFASSGFALPFVALFDSLRGWVTIPMNTVGMHTPWLTSLGGHAVAGVGLAICLHRARR